MNVVAFAGDGATVGCRFPVSFWGCRARDNIIYICYDNEGYMNTGYQGAGPLARVPGPVPTLNREGEGGKLQHKKDIALIMAMHGVPYVA